MKEDRGKVLARLLLADLRKGARFRMDDDDDGGEGPDVSGLGAAMDERLHALFEEYDRDGNGYLDLAEMKKLYRAIDDFEECFPTHDYAAAPAADPDAASLGASPARQRMLREHRKRRASQHSALGSSDAPRTRADAYEKYVRDQIAKHAKGTKDEKVTFEEFVCIMLAQAAQGGAAT